MTSGRQDAEFSIALLNRAPVDDAAAMLDSILECSPWLARRVAGARPFTDLRALDDAIAAEIAALSDAEKLALLRAHPELAPPAPDTMTRASQTEQARLALAHPSADVARRLRDLNRRYEARHGFPFVIALHACRDLDSVFTQFAARVEQDTGTEIARALDEVVSVARARLSRRFAASPLTADAHAARAS